MCTRPPAPSRPSTSPQSPMITAERSSRPINSPSSSRGGARCADSGCGLVFHNTLRRLRAQPHRDLGHIGKSLPRAVHSIRPPSGRKYEEDDFEVISDSEFRARTPSVVGATANSPRRRGRAALEAKEEKKKKKPPNSPRRSAAAWRRRWRRRRRRAPTRTSSSPTRTTASPSSPSCDGAAGGRARAGARAGVPPAVAAGTWRTRSRRSRTTSPGSRTTCRT